MTTVKKLFQKALFGFSKKQVEEYCDQSRAAVLKLEQSKEEYRLKCDELQQQVEDFKQREREIGRALVNAAIVAKNIVADAEGKAKEILGKADLEVQAKFAESDKKLHQKTIALQAMEAEISGYRELCRRHATQLMDALEHLPGDENVEKNYGNNVVTFSEEKRQAY